MCQSWDTRPDNLYCANLRKKLKSCRDLDLCQTMPITELIQDIFMYYNIFKFQVPRRYFHILQ